MAAELDEQVDHLFVASLAILPDERAAFLDTECGRDSAVRRKVEAMLATAEQADRYFRSLSDRLAAGAFGPAPVPGEGAEHLPPAEVPIGTVIGGYRLLRELGRGGMASVWLAERTDGMVNRPVALKFPHGAWLMPGLAERMKQERDILAQLSHPNIARLYDAGLTEDGRPYLALEYVEGSPIDRYCDSHELALVPRLRLLLQVARAVAHAHAQLVVHRDIKPSNVLVTAAGEVRLLDFGIAKLIAQDAAQASALTSHTGRALTIDYAAPEQILGQPISIAADVYSLGVLAFEMLTGKRPYQLSRESRGALEEAILRVDPSRPSDCAPFPWRKQLRGDLDTIVLKALKKLPQERYETVNAFIDDIERHLSSRPVLARPDSLWYRMGRLVARNRLAFGAASVTLVAIIVGAVVAVVQANTANRERARAEQVQRFLVGVFAAADPNQSKGVDVTAREILDRATARVDGEFVGQDAMRADLTLVIGSIYGSLSEQALAQRLLEQSLALRERSEPDSAAHAETLTELARLVSVRGDYERAEVLARRALQIRERLGEPEGIVSAASELGMVLHRRDKLEEAERQYRRALALARAKLGAHPLTPRAIHTLGSLLEQRNQLDEAERLHLEALNMRRSLVGELHLDMIESHYNLAVVQYKRGRYEDALQSHQRALAVIRTITPQGHSDAQYMLNGMAQAHEKLGQHEEAEARYREALALIQHQFGDDHPNAAIVSSNLAQLLAAQGRTAEAELLLRGALDTMTQAIPRSPRRLQAAVALADIESGRGRHDAAEVVLLAAHQAAPTPASAAALADLYTAWGRADEAARYRSLAEAP